MNNKIVKSREGGKEEGRRRRFEERQKKGNSGCRTRKLKQRRKNRDIKFSLTSGTISLKNVKVTS